MSNYFGYPTYSSTDVVAYAFNAALHCTGCIDERTAERIGAEPVFAGAEFDCSQCCDQCGDEIDGLTILDEDE